MSSSPRDPQDEGADKQSLDELDEPQAAGDAEPGEQSRSLITSPLLKNIPQFSQRPPPIPLIIALHY